VLLGYDRNERPLHTRANVYRQMIVDISLYYKSLPDVRTLTYSEIEFFYDGIRPLLKRDSK
jgi:hypothetical protein